MKNKQLLFNLIIAGMTLGTTWAIRGQFGHEQGAAWAGAVGGLVILLLGRREDWYNKMFKAALAAAIGWGLGGMMSYGRVVGFGRGTDFGNVYYGLLMLFIIGGLYGFIGGGLFGLTLTENKKTISELAIQSELQKQYREKGTLPDQFVDAGSIEYSDDPEVLSSNVAKEIDKGRKNLEKVLQDIGIAIPSNDSATVNPTNPPSRDTKTARDLKSAATKEVLSDMRERGLIR